MTLPPEMLSLIACPQCAGGLHDTKEQVLFCIRCRLCFPVENGVPHLSLDKALPLSPEGKIIPREETAFFSIEEGKDSGVYFRLQKGTCKAIGRKIEDSIQTQLFNADFTMTLDEHTKKLILNYLTKKTGKEHAFKSRAKAPLDLGAFKRLPDLILNDEAASRLHAMIFYDEGGVGILDLVSKNGTFVNGREVEARMLQSGDEIKIGGTRALFSLK